VVLSDQPNAAHQDLAAPADRNEPEGRAAPAALVHDGIITYGSWLGIPGKANLIDAARPYHYPLPRFLKRLRMKEWRAIQAGDEKWFLCAVLYDAKFMSMASIDIWDRVNKKKYGFRNIFPGSRFSMPNNFDSSETRMNSGSNQLSIGIDQKTGILHLKSSARSHKAGADGFDLNLSFDISEGACAPFSVCLPFGLNRAMYSTKILMPCSGILAINGLEHTFDSVSASGAFDDHKGYYPYRLHYDWVTGFGIDGAGRRIGFNLTDNQVKDQVRYNENRLWIGNDIYPLPPVKITRPNGKEALWNIQDTEGMVDLRFQPEVSHDIQVKLGFAEIDYSGPFGRFEGTLRTTSGEVINASILYGMGEDKNVRL